MDAIFFNRSHGQNSLLCVSVANFRRVADTFTIGVSLLDCAALRRFGKNVRDGRGLQRAHQAMTQIAWSMPRAVQQLANDKTQLWSLNEIHVTASSKAIRCSWRSQ
jgi:hypothetical protein